MAGAVLRGLLAAGCGGEDLVFPGEIPTAVVEATPTVACIATGGACTLDSDCCSGVCQSADGMNFTCQ
jgi:hypothetical protein